MLERTAGCLESSSLRRLLPVSGKAVKSRRTLHSGFWNHAAGDLELSPLWATLVRSFDEQAGTETEQKNSTGTGSLFLDFLYPTGTINFLRNYSGWAIDRADGRWARTGRATIGHRLYTSSAGVSLATELRGENEAESKPKLGVEDQSIPELGDEDESESITPIDLGSEESQKEILRNKMGLKKSSNYEEAWRQYFLLNPVDQQHVRRQLIGYFSTSNRILDAERIVDLFGWMERGEKDALSYQRAVISQLKLRNLPDALQLYKKCLKTVGEPAGSAEILSYLANVSSWSQAGAIWLEVVELRTRNPNLDYDICAVIDNLPNYSDLACQFADYVDRKTEKSRASCDLVSLAMSMVRKALFQRQSFSQERFTKLLRYLQTWGHVSPGLFEKVVDMLWEIDQRHLTTNCYEIVRGGKWGGTGALFSHKTLHKLLDAFCRSHNLKGIQEVLDDFYRYYGKPSLSAYKMSMIEFASHGDAGTVHAIFKKLITDHFPGKNGLPNSDFLAPILQVHAKRGELQIVIERFNEISNQYGLKPSILCWNILINAYCKVHDIDSAFACFEQLLEIPDIKPDDVTLATLMGICTTRGDLERTVELYQLCDDLNIQKSCSMVDCLVLGHIDEDRLQDAENICVQAVSMDLIGTRTRMWNYLIVAYAMRRDLKSAHRICQRMAEFKIEHDTYTYAALMQALTVVKQPDQAWKILRDVLPAAGFKPDAFHYAIIMGGFLANRETSKVFAVHDMFVQQDFRSTISTNTLLLRAEVKEDLKMMNEGTEVQRFERAMRMFMGVVNTMNLQEVTDTARKTVGRLPIDIAYPTAMFSYFMFVVAQLNEYQTVEDLFTLYKSLIPAHRRDKPPITIISAMMISNWYQRDLPKVHSCWGLALAQARADGLPLIPEVQPEDLNDPNVDVSEPARKAKKGRVLHRHQLDLSKCLSIQLKALALDGRIGEMTQTVNHLMEEGFVLDNHNWNTYVRLLCRRNRWKLAFQTAEQRLLQSSAKEKRKAWRPTKDHIRKWRRNPRYYWPYRITMLFLTRAYIEIQESAGEFLSSEMLLNDLERECPYTVFAIKTMRRSADPLEADILQRF